MRSCKHFERKLRIKSELWSKYRNTIEQVSFAKIDDKICIRGCSRNAIDITRQRTHKHVLNP
jgi:hypothetical protein